MRDERKREKDEIDGQLPGENEEERQLKWSWFGLKNLFWGMFPLMKTIGIIFV